MNSWIISILFIVVGLGMALFINRFAAWWFGLTILLFRVAPWLNFTGADIDVKMTRWFNSRFYFLLIWSWRIMGVLLTGAGTLILYSLIN